MPRTLEELSTRERQQLLVCYDGARLGRISQPRAAAILNVTCATLKKLLNRRQTVEAHRCAATSRETNAENRRFMDVETGLLRWLRDAQRRRWPVDEAVLLAKAGELAALLGVTHFTANLTWILHWKYKYNVSDNEVRRVPYYRVAATTVDREHNRDPDYDLNRDQNRDYNRDSDLNHNRNPDCDLNRDQNRDQNRDYNHDSDLNHKINPDCELNRHQSRDQNRDYNHDSNLNHNRNPECDLNRDQNRNDDDGWLASVRDAMCRYDADDVYSVVETGFFYLQSDGERRRARRIAVVLVCNVTGTDKLKPLVVDDGRDDDPWFLRHVRPHLLQRDGRWTTGSFGSFVERWDRAVRPRRRVLVVLDRKCCSVALPPETRLRNVELLARFPADRDRTADAAVHPLAAHVIRNAAAYEFYAVRMLPPAGYVTVPDFVHLLSDVWRNVPPPVIRNGFRDLGWTDTAVERVRDDVRADFARWIVHYYCSAFPVRQTAHDGVPRLNGNDAIGENRSISAPPPMQLTAGRPDGNVQTARRSRRRRQ